MPLVPTVLGPVEAASLGRTLMHEHIFILTTDAAPRKSKRHSAALRAL